MMAPGAHLNGLFAGHLGKAYLIQVVEGEVFQILQLWQPKDTSLETFEQLYPQTEQFYVDEPVITSKFEGEIPDADLATLLRMLRKGGKAAYHADDSTTIIEISPTTGGIDTLLKFEDAD
ncbi:MAG: hypothetical protein IPK16_01590 [Anaerolineales bacterium]|nr:hypothetical protein [Anaerolineales bacterium]